MGTVRGTLPAFRLTVIVNNKLYRNVGDYLSWDGEIIVPLTSPPVSYAPDEITGAVPISSQRVLPLVSLIFKSAGRDTIRNATGTQKSRKGDDVEHLSFLAEVA